MITNALRGEWDWITNFTRASVGARSRRICLQNISDRAELAMRPS